MTCPLKIGLFSSGHFGQAILARLLTDPDRFQVVFVCRDDPLQPDCHPDQRAWQFLDRHELPRRVDQLAQAHQIPVDSGSLRDPLFKKFIARAGPTDVHLSAFFGQRLPNWLLRRARLGSYNLHAVYPRLWPNPQYAGPCALMRLLADRRPCAYWALHHMTEEFDAGPLVAWSDEPAPLHPDETLADCMQRMAQFVAKFTLTQLEGLTFHQGRCSTAPQS